MTDLVPTTIERTATSLTVPRNYTLEQCQTLLDGMLQIEGAVQFWIGDILLYADSIKTDGASELADQFSAKSLLNYRWVAEHVAPEQRVEGLSWSHHVEVAKLAPDMQAVWLEASKQGGWSRTELRQQLRGGRGKEVRDECICQACGNKHTCSTKK